MRRVVCTVDCGRPINPLGVAAENFSDYLLMHLDQAVNVEVPIIPSEHDLLARDAMGIPIAGPALMNAIFAARDTRIRARAARDQLRRV